MRTLDIGRPLDILALQQARQAGPGAYEANEEAIYDTATYLAAGVPSLDFFSVASGDRTITNLVQPGLIPAGEYFHAKRVFVVPLVEPTISADLTAAGRVRDLERVMVTGRGTLSITPAYSNRPRGPYPLHLIGAVGSTHSRGYGTDAPAAGNSAVVEVAAPSSHGGVPVDFILFGGETLAATMRWGNPLAISADMPLQLIVWGFRYRKAA